MAGDRTDMGAPVRRLTAVAIGVVLCAAGMAAAGAQVFRAGVDTVVLSVTVTDGHNHPITGIPQSLFQVFEDGVPQTISFFAPDRQPIALSLLIDSSSSMDDKIGVAQAAATGFVQRLGPRDVAQIVDFNSDQQIRQTFTNDVPSLERAILAIRTGGSTSLYTALYVAISELDRRRAEAPGEIRRRAIVILSDGEDTTSIKTYDDVAELAKGSDVAIYAVGLRDRQGAYARGFNEADFALRTLSQVTGGRVYFVTDIQQLPGVYGEIADELANQYVIGYNPINPQRNGAWRQIGVRVARPETVVRTRSGYFGRAKEQ
jgi:Ca-activated chloride channel family protein